jgi:BlaI family transcriptional regulator, penicillinase repressor
LDILLTDREADIMQVLWTRGPSTVAEVQTALSDELAYTTVLSMLRTLEQKSYVDYETEGRTHRYHATVERQAARKSALQHLKGKLFDGSAELVLTQLVSDHKLSKRELTRLRKLLEEMSGKDTP